VLLFPFPRDRIHHNSNHNFSFLKTGINSDPWGLLLQLQILKSVSESKHTTSSPSSANWNWVESACFSYKNSRVWVWIYVYTVLQIFRLEICRDVERSEVTTQSISRIPYHQLQLVEAFLSHYETLQIYWRTSCKLGVFSFVCSCQSFCHRNTALHSIGEWPQRSLLFQVFVGANLFGIWIWLCSLSWKQQSSVLHILLLCAQQLEIVEVLMMLLETYLCGTYELHMEWKWRGDEDGIHFLLQLISLLNSFVWGSAQIGNAVEKLSGHLFWFLETTWSHVVSAERHS
jgi:hypothetical protein